MIDDSKSVLLIDKNKVLCKSVDEYHIYAIQDLIDEYYDNSYIVKDHFSNDKYYAEAVSDDLSLVVVLVNRMLSIMYVPKDFNNYQLSNIKKIYGLLKYYRDNNITYGLLTRYNNKNYNDEVEFLDSVKRLKR